MSTNKKQVVVVGGGMCGMPLVAALRDSSAKNVFITLIEPREDFVYFPISIRNSIEDATQYYIKPYDRIFANKPNMGEVIHEVAVGVDENEKCVKLASGRMVKYDILVLATGAHNSDPNTVPLSTHDEILAYTNAQRQKIQDAYHIFIVGGGPRGVELGCELGDYFRSTKKITLVHSGALPLSSTFSTKLRQLVLTFLLQSRVNVMLKATAIDNGDGTVKVTRNTREKEVVETMQYDAIYTLYGSTPASEWLPSAWKNDAGYAVVSPTFQLASDPSVFALGDISTAPGAHTVEQIPQIMPTVVTNILAMLRDKPVQKEYKHPGDDLILTMGRWRSTGQAVYPVVGTVLLPFWFISMADGAHAGAEKGVKPLGY
ncbi:uncharacterized protein V1518DRAFT_275824 [Limtongia smithiae]|uniref:uncharacterized protein n=1 Tax=Limtongia smithiae TaxID=1125753 RepID=UPI0034CDC7C5